MEKESKKTETAKKNNSPLASGTGRRKSAIARVWLKRGAGSLTVNKKKYEDYFNTEITRQSAYLPFNVHKPAATIYSAEVNVQGGGVSAQADAIKLGLARAFLQANPEIKALLREHGLLTVDSRLKERKKYGQKGARRKFQFVKR